MLYFFVSFFPVSTSPLPVCMVKVGPLITFYGGADENMGSKVSCRGAANRETRTMVMPSNAFPLIQHLNDVIFPRHRDLCLLGTVPMFSHMDCRGGGTLRERMM